MKPTERQRYLMGFAGNGSVAAQFGEGPHSFWRVNASHPKETLGTSRLIRAYRYFDHDKNPSRPELQKLLALGWAELRPDPDHWTENTQTGERWQHYRVWLTEAGMAALEGK